MLGNVTLRWADASRQIIRGQDLAVESQEESRLGKGACEGAGRVCTP